MPAAASAVKSEATASAGVKAEPKQADLVSLQEMKEFIRSRGGSIPATQLTQQFKSRIVVRYPPCTCRVLLAISKPEQALPSECGALHHLHDCMQRQFCSGQCSMCFSSVACAPLLPAAEAVVAADCSCTFLQLDRCCMRLLPNRMLERAD